MLMTARAILLALGLVSSSAMAGPPYITDDPAPTDLAKWEVYTFVDGSFDHGAFGGATGFDLNYGALPGLQLTATLPLDLTAGGGNGLRARKGDVEVAAKFRFVNDEKSGVSIAAFPRLILPTSGEGKAAVLLPLWAEMDKGDWSVFGGGGITLRNGLDARDSWQQGLAVTRALSDKATVGVELAHEGADADGGHGVTTAGVGAVVALGGPVSLLMSAGPEFEDGTGTTSVHAYAALGFDF